MKALLISLLLIIGSLAVQDESMQIIQKLEASPAGKRIIDTIALQLQTQDSADDLIRMLEEQEDKLQKEQDKEDDFILKLQNQCVVDLRKLKKEIAETRIKIQQLADLIKALTPVKEDKEASKSDALAFKKKLEDRLKEVDESIKAKNAEWATEKVQHDSQTAIIQKAKDIIVGGFSVNFLETKSQRTTQILAQVSSHFNQARKQHFNSKGIQSIFRVLSQISSSREIQAESEAIQKIVDICDNILDRIAESRNIEKRDWQLHINEQNQIKEKLTARLNKVEAKITKLSTEIAILSKRLSVATGNLAQQKVRLEQKIQQHDARETFCDEAGGKYAKEREARSDQEGIISDAIGLLTSKIRLLKRYVGERTQKLSKPFP